MAGRRNNLYICLLLPQFNLGLYKNIVGVPRSTTQLSSRYN